MNRNAATQETLARGRAAAIDSNRAKSSAARRRVEDTLSDMDRDNSPLPNTTIQRMAHVHPNWLYDHRDVKARAEAIRARIRDDRLGQILAHRTGIEEELRVENEQLLDRARHLQSHLAAVQDALADCRAASENPTAALAGLDTISDLREHIDHLETCTAQLTIERDTAVLDRKRMGRDLKAAHSGLADAERTIVDLRGR